MEVPTRAADDERAEEKRKSRLEKKMRMRLSKFDKSQADITEENMENRQASGRLNMRTMIERRVPEERRKLKRRKRRAEREKRLQEARDQEMPGTTTTCGTNKRRGSADFEMDYIMEESFASTKDVQNTLDSTDKQNHNAHYASAQNFGITTLETKPGHSGENEVTAQSQNQQHISTAISHSSMTKQERAWWAMSFEELYQHARSKGCGKTGNVGRKSGRVRIIKKLCKREGIIPYVAPSIAPAVEASPLIGHPPVRPSGAISHPEALLRTSDPILQLQIDVAEKRYLTWKTADLLELAMQRSYQLLKDNHGKLPSKSKSAMANWLAAWDILKSPREKEWWLGDGIDLINKAKAMGYEGAASTKKYDVIVWLRAITADTDIGLPEVAEPTPNSRPGKHNGNESAKLVSKRLAKGSKRPNGWDIRKLAQA